MSVRCSDVNSPGEETFQILAELQFFSSGIIINTTNRNLLLS